MISNAAIVVASKEGQHLHHQINNQAGQELWQVRVWTEPQLIFAFLENNLANILIIDLAVLSQICVAEQFFSTLRTKSFQTEVLLIIAPDEREQAIQLLAQGAADYLMLPFDDQELGFRLKRILEIQHLKQASIRSASLNSAGNDLLMLREASHEISRTLQLDEVLKIVLSKASQFAGTELSRVYLTDQDGRLIEDHTITKTSLPANDPTREVHLLNILAQETAFSQEMMYRTRSSDLIWQDQRLQAALLLPLVSGDKLLGVLTLGSQQLTPYSANQIRWLSIFCGQAATAIENARLFQDLASAYIDLAQSREKILQSRNTLQVLFDSIGDGLYILNQDFSISMVNALEADRVGMPVDTLIGQSYLALPGSNRSLDLLDRIKEALQSGHETMWISPDNETEPYLKDREFRIYPIRNRLAQIEQVVVFAQDVAERRRWQASLFRSANLAAVGQLAGSVAHQINNPLTVAMANSQLMLLEAASGSEMHELATGIFKAGDRIQNIVENLLEFSNQETYFFVQTDLINTIEGALALVFRSLKKAKIEVIKDYRAAPILSASVSHLKLVWMNFLLNARDAMQDYTAQPQLTIVTESISEREVRVIIADNGMGIAEKDFDQLFRPFFTTKLAEKALGLGLYSAYTIIERHNGQIKVVSQPGLETRFEVTLPLDNPRDL
jgi:signal transduction histidine kinase/DNA-binding response OmpR family regulator